MRTPPPITDSTPIGPDVDLDRQDIRLSGGRRLTKDVVDEFVDAAQRGRPSLTGPGKHSPSVTVRLPEALSDALSAEAARTGRKRSEIIREALEARLAS